MAFVSLDDIDSIDESSNCAMPLLDSNWQTTAAVGLSVASGGVAGAIMLAAFPAQTLVTGAAIGSLAVAGKRRANGEDPCFGLTARFTAKKSDEKSEATEPKVTAEAAPAAA